MSLAKGARGPAVLDLQNELRSLGFDPGPCDGILGDRTLGALSEFCARLSLQSLSKDVADDNSLWRLSSEYRAWKLGLIRGVDVAVYQRQIDWAAVAASGVAFAFAKATEAEHFHDPTFHANWDGIARAGLLRGAYLFFRANADPVKEAETFADAVGKHLGHGDLPPAVDVETEDGASPTTLLQRAKECLVNVERLLGIRPILYSYGDFLSREGLSALADYPLWLASYTSVAHLPRGFSAIRFWQFSSTSRFPGIGTAASPVACDENRFLGSREELRLMSQLSEE